MKSVSDNYLLESEYISNKYSITNRRF